jgi:hypothetical protein
MNQLGQYIETSRYQGFSVVARAGLKLWGLAFLTPNPSHLLADKRSQYEIILVIVFLHRTTNAR